MDSKLIEILNAGYTIESWYTFCRRNDLPSGLIARVQESVPPLDRQFVIYDIHDDGEGWILCGANLQELIDETFSERIAHA